MCPKLLSALHKENKHTYKDLTKKNRNKNRQESIPFYMGLSSHRLIGSFNSLNRRLHSTPFDHKVQAHVYMAARQNLTFMFFLN